MKRIGTEPWHLSAGRLINKCRISGVSAERRLPPRRLLSHQRTWAAVVARHHDSSSPDPSASARKAAQSQGRDCRASAQTSAAEYIPASAAHSPKTGTHLKGPATSADEDLDVPTPKAFPVVGNLPLLFKKDTQTESLMELMKEFDHDIFKFEMPGLQPYVMVGNPEYAQKCCFDKENFAKICTDDWTDAFSGIRELTAKGIFSASDTEKEWGMSHRILASAFSFSGMRTAVPMAVNATKNVMAFLDRQDPDSKVDVSKLMTGITFDVIGSFSASMDLGTSADPAVVETHPFLKLMVKSNHLANLTVEWGALCRLNLPLMKEHRETGQALHSYVGDIIQERKQILKENSLTEKQKEDMLTCMLTTPDPETGLYLDEKTISDNLITFFIAGHDTTSTTLTTAFYYLSMNPDVEKRVLDEIREVIGSGTDVVPTLAHLNKLKYTTQVLKETMRLNPPIIYIQRTAVKDTNLGPHFIKEGTTVVTMTEALHRNPNVWGDDADSFDPDRFSPEAEASRHPGSWMPFAVGARSCIGMQLAMTEARVALAMLLPRYSFQLHSSANVKRDLDKVLVTLSGVEMTVQPRELSRQQADVRSSNQPKSVVARDAAVSNNEHKATPHHPPIHHDSADLHESKCPFQAMFKHLS